MENQGGGIISSIVGAIGGIGGAEKIGAIDLHNLFNSANVIAITEQTIKVAWFAAVGGVIGWLVKEALDHLKNKTNGTSV